MLKLYLDILHGLNFDILLAANTKNKHTTLKYILDFKNLSIKEFL